MPMMTCKDCKNQYSDLVEKCPKCGSANPYYVSQVLENKSKKNKKGIYGGVIAGLVIILIALICFLLIPSISGKSIVEEKPVPFSDVTWGDTMEKVKKLQGIPNDEYNSEDGYIYQYDNCTIDGFTGVTRYAFDDTGLYEVIFDITGNQAADAYSYYENKYQDDYGESDFENIVGKIWHEKKANYGVAMAPLGEGEAIMTFGKPMEDK